MEASNILEIFKLNEANRKTKLLQKPARTFVREGFRKKYRRTSQGRGGNKPILKDRGSLKWAARFRQAAGQNNSSLAQKTTMLLDVNGSYSYRMVPIIVLSPPGSNKREINLRFNFYTVYEIVLLSPIVPFLHARKGRPLSETASYRLFSSPYFNHLSSQFLKTRCQRMPFCGCITQWFSSGKNRNCAGISRITAALNAPIPCV